MILEIGISKNNCANLDNKYERLLEWKQMVAREVALEIGISKNNCANLDKKYEKQLEWKQSNTMTCI